MKKLILLLTLFLFSFSCYNTDTWPNGIIQYTYKGKITISDYIIIENAMKEWMKHANIKFVYVKNPKTTECIYVIEKLKKDVGFATSTVGYKRKAGMKFYYIDDRTALHELGHCLGFRHEHQRPDRNKHIKINNKNVKKTHLHSFNLLKKEEFLFDYEKFPYDHNSIMHYGKKSFSKNKKITIVSPEKINNRNLSKIDIEKIQYVYGSK